MKINPANIEVIDDKMAFVLKNKTPQQRLEIAFKMWDSAKIQLKTYLKSIHNDWDEDTINKEVIRRLSHGAI